MIVSSGRSVAELINIVIKGKGVADHHTLLTRHSSNWIRHHNSSVIDTGSNPVWRAN